jgi:hypothetical protein
MPSTEDALRWFFALSAEEREHVIRDARQRMRHRAVEEALLALALGATHGWTFRATT